MMEYFDTELTKQAVGLPSEEERKSLISDGYSFAFKVKNTVIKTGEHSEYEVWSKPQLI